jgi:hypothetical protein
VRNLVWKAVDIAMNIATLSMYLIRRAILIEPVFIKNLTWRRERLGCRLQPDKSWFDCQLGQVVYRFFFSNRPDFGAHLASYLMGTGGKGAEAREAESPSHSVSRVRLSSFMPALSNTRTLTFALPVQKEGPLMTMYRTRCSVRNCIQLTSMSNIWSR